MSSRDLVPYGHGRETTRDLVPYESGRASLHPQRESRRDSRGHQTTARGQTSLRDHYPYGRERESPRPRRESTWDSSQRTVRGQTSYHDDYPRGLERLSIRPGRESTRDSSHTTVRGQTSRHDDYPRAGERVSIRPGRESTRDSRSHQTTTSAYTSPRGHTPHQASARRDSRTNTNYSIPQETAERLWQLDEAYYSNDGETITQRARYSNLTQNTTTEFEVRETPTSRTRIRSITHGSHRSPDVHSIDDPSREHNTHRTGSSRHPPNTGSARRDNLTLSRDTPRRTAGGYRPTYDESRSSTRR